MWDSSESDPNEFRAFKREFGVYRAVFDSKGGVGYSYYFVWRVSSDE